MKVYISYDLKTNKIFLFYLFFFEIKIFICWQKIVEQKSSALDFNNIRLYDNVVVDVRS